MPPNENYNASFFGDENQRNHALRDSTDLFRVRPTGKAWYLFTNPFTLFASDRMDFVKTAGMENQERFPQSYCRKKAHESQKMIAPIGLIFSVGTPGAPLLARLTKVPAHLNSLLAKLKLLPLFATPPKWAAFPSSAQV